jgi:serine protease
MNFEGVDGRKGVFVGDRRVRVYTVVLLVAVMFLSTQSFAKNSHRTTSSRSASNILPGIVVVKFRSSEDPVILHSTSVGGILLKQNAYKSAASVDAEFKRFPSATLANIFPARKNLTFKDPVGMDRIFYFKFPVNENPYAVAESLSRSPLVEYAEPHFTYKLQFTPNDPDYTMQSYLKQIHADSAWTICNGSPDVVIGIVDSGTDWQHPDLSANIAINSAEDINHDGKFENWPSTEIRNGVSGDLDGIDEDGDGYVDDVVGWDFAGADGNTPDNDPSPGEPHGTHTAGIASAVTNNGIGVASVGYQCKILPVKTSVDDPTNDEILYGDEGIKYAADRGANIISCSWGGPAGSSFEQDVIRYALAKGSIVIAAAGNDGANEFFYPASNPGVFSVASVSSSDTKSSFTNYGPLIGICAPGENIYSTYPNDSYAYSSGTSMSTPVVAAVAALVKSYHPSWTMEQVLQQVRVSAANINALNPSYTHMLGLGRVDALRALTVRSPAIQLASFSVSDSAFGNGNNVVEPGEDIQIFCTTENYLQSATNVSVTLVSTDPYATMVDSTFQIGSLDSLASATNSSQPFRVHVSSSVPENETMTFLLLISASGYSDYSSFSILASPSFRNSDVAGVELSFTAKGDLGFDDYPNNTVGAGFVDKSTQDNMMFEGAFMAGTGPTMVEDVARDGIDGSTQDVDFVAAGPVQTLQPGVLGDQDVLTSFKENDSLSQKIGFSVQTHAFAFSQTQPTNAVFIRYILKNISSNDLTGLYCGLYFDWDIGEVYDNVAGFDGAHNLGYVYDTTTADVQRYGGITVLSKQGTVQYHAIDNADEGSGEDWGVYDGFTKAEKWDALHSGVSKASAGPSDVSFFIGAGPYSIAAGDSAFFGVAIMASPTLDALQTSAALARTKWLDLNLDAVGPAAPVSSLPKQFALYQNYPNPFNPTTVIAYQVPVKSHVTVIVYDMLGREVATLVDGEKPAGSFTALFDASRFSSGVYFYRMQAGTFSETKKFVLMK